MRVFITGLTGTLGTALAKFHHDQGDQVWGCARSESKAVEWIRKNQNIGTLYVNDAINLTKPTTDIGRLLPTIDRVYHCAALKHVDICEQQPFDAVMLNTVLTSALAIECRLNSIPLVVASSDKACLPQSVYGASKLLAERVAIRERASVVRLGNLIGSSGSVFQTWLNTKQEEPIKVTNRKMTRYFVDVPHAAKFIANNVWPGYVVIPNPLLSVNMGEVADSVAKIKNVDVIETGNRPGETLHQWLIAPGEPYVDYGGELVIQDDGRVDHKGLSSETAPRWNIDDLLAIAKRTV